jgi:integrase
VSSNLYPALVPAGAARADGREDVVGSEFVAGRARHLLVRAKLWLDLSKAVLTVGDSKTEVGEGRTIPLNSELLEAIVGYSRWYTARFGTIQPDWYVFASAKPVPNDPARAMVTLKTAWRNVKKAAGVTGRWHDTRHTCVTDLAESGAGDETIRDIAGHVSKQMLSHYSHIRMEAKRKALESILTKKTEPAPEAGTVANSNGISRFSTTVDHRSGTSWTRAAPIPPSG